MSKRFGRNQKRRARETAAKLAQTEMALRNTRTELHCLVRRLIDCGPNSFYLDVEAHAERWYERRMPTILREGAPFDMSGPHIIEDRVPVWLLEELIQRHADDFARMKHYRMRGATHQVSYAVSEEALALTGSRRAATRYVADGIANEIARHFKPERSASHGAGAAARGEAGE